MAGSTRSIFFTSQVSDIISCDLQNLLPHNQYQRSRDWFKFNVSRFKVYIPRLSNLMIENPEIEIEFLTGAEVVNLAKRDADIALRLVRPSQRDLIVRKTGEMTLGLFMHPKLLQGRKKPQHLEQLKSFPFVGLVARATSDFEFKLLQKLEPHIRYSLRSAAWSSVFYSIQAGLGWGILPTFFEDRDPELIQINVVEPITTPLWLVAHPDIIKSARVRVVVDSILKS
jgi:DNA-binding transcriptional LysR family regulator